MTSKPTLNSISVIYNPKSPPAVVAPATLPPPVKLVTSRVLIDPLLVLHTASHSPTLTGLVCPKFILAQFY